MKYIVKAGIYVEDLEIELNAFVDQGYEIINVISTEEIEFVIIARNTYTKKKAKKK